MITDGAPAAAPRLELVEELPAGAPTHTVADPYRWLEDAADPRTAAWSAAQDAAFAAAAAGWPGRERLRARLEELLAVGSVGTPAWRGERRFSTRRDGDRDHPSLLVTEPDPEHPGRRRERVLVDPLALDPSGLTTLDAWQPSKEGDLLAVQLSAGGTEESVLRVLDVATGEVVDGPIDRMRLTSVAWLPGGGAFYYVRRLDPALLPAGEEQYHRRVWRHVVGTDPAGDVEVFGAGMPITTYYGVGVSLDGRWLVVSAREGTAPRTDVWLGDLAAGPSTPDGTADGSEDGVPDLVPVAVGLDASTAAAVGRDGRLYVATDLGAPRGRLAVADPQHPGPEHWRDLLPEREDAVLEDFALLDAPAADEDGDGVPARRWLLAGWTRHAVGEITVHDAETGERIGEVPLPGVGTVGGITRRPEGGTEAWFGFTGTTTPSQVMRWDGATGEVVVEAVAPGVAARAAAASSDGAPGGVAEESGHGVVTRELLTTSTDGTAVRMLLVTRADHVGPDGGPTGPRPAVLYGYGGFGITLSPAYSAAALAWVEAGGAWVTASLRGGGEEGEDWHRAGMLGRKQRVFDDFHACARQLAADGWTTPAQLTASGGSNGGLLVGAALAQHPELFGAVLCSAPLLDMVRYQLHGLGATWASEYGDAEDPEQLGWLLAYSPYHAVEAAGPGRPYPATLFTVFDGDSRVDPLHARKLCAALQHATGQDGGQRGEPSGARAGAGAGAGPVLLRREADVGHGARAVSRSVALLVDTLAFAAHHTGLDLA